MFVQLRLIEILMHILLFLRTLIQTISSSMNNNSMILNQGYHHISISNVFSMKITHILHNLYQIISIINTMISISIILLNLLQNQIILTEVLDHLPHLLVTTRLLQCQSMSTTMAKMITVLQTIILHNINLSNLTSTIKKVTSN